jgi:hypothetical protein
MFELAAALRPPSLNRSLLTHSPSSARRACALLLPLAAASAGATAAPGCVCAERRRAHPRCRTVGSRTQIDIYSPAFRRLLKCDPSLRPPMGASPGELRLWLKLHGLMDDSMRGADAKTKSRLLARQPGVSGHAALGGVGGRPRKSGVYSGRGRLPPISCKPEAGAPSAHARRALAPALAPHHAMVGKMEEGQRWRRSARQPQGGAEES